jgi:hypothetical protein
LKQFSSSTKPLTWTMAIFANFKYSSSLRAIDFEEVKDFEGYVI